MIPGFTASMWNWKFLFKLSITTTENVDMLLVWCVIYLLTAHSTTHC